MSQREFFEERIAECEAAEAATELPNVRELQRHAKARWQALLDREAYAERVRTVARTTAESRAS